MKKSKVTILGILALSSITGIDAEAATPIVKTNLPKTTLKTNESFSLSYSLINSKSRKVSNPTGSITLNSYTDSSCSQGQAQLGSALDLSSSNSSSYSFSGGGLYYVKPEISGYTGQCLGPIDVKLANVPFQALTASSSIANNKRTLFLRWEDLSGNLSVEATSKASISLYSNSSCSGKRISGSRVSSVSPKNGQASLVINNNSSPLYAKSISGSLSSCVSVSSQNDEPTVQACSTSDVSNSTQVSGTKPNCIAESCTDGFHVNPDSGSCESDVIECSDDTGTGTQTWNGSSFGSCFYNSCLNSNYEVIAGSCFVLNNAPTGSENFIAVIGQNNRRVVNPNGKLEFPLQIGSVDPDGDALSYSVSEPEFGQASVTEDGRIFYSPNLGYHGTDSFNYTVSDGVHQVTNTVSVTVLNLQFTVRSPSIDGPSLRNVTLSSIEPDYENTFDWYLGVSGTLYLESNLYLDTSMFTGLDVFVNDIQFNSSATKNAQSGEFYYWAVSDIIYPNINIDVAKPYNFIFKVTDSSSNIIAKSLPITLSIGQEYDGDQLADYDLTNDLVYSRQQTGYIPAGETSTTIQLTDAYGVNLSPSSVIIYQENIDPEYNPVQEYLAGINADSVTQPAPFSTDNWILGADYAPFPGSVEFDIAAAGEAKPMALVIPSSGVNTYTFYKYRQAYDLENGGSNYITTDPVNFTFTVNSTGLLTATVNYGAGTPLPADIEVGISWYMSVSNRVATASDTDNDTVSDKVELQNSTVPNDDTSLKYAFYWKNGSGSSTLPLTTRSYRQAMSISTSTLKTKLENDYLANKVSRIDRVILTFATGDRAIWSLDPSISASLQENVIDSSIFFSKVDTILEFNTKLSDTYTATRSIVNSSISDITGGYVISIGDNNRAVYGPSGIAGDVLIYFHRSSGGVWSVAVETDNSTLLSIPMDSIAVTIADPSGSYYK